MSSSVHSQQGDVVVVTQMYPTPPQGGSVGNPNHHNMIGLGAVQIMIGMMVLSFGVSELVLDTSSLAVKSGVYWWASVDYIIAGSLTVAAGKSTDRCLMNTTVFYNIVACLVAISGVSLYAVDAAVTYANDCDEDECDKFKQAMQGMSSILAMFQFLEFIIAIVAASFACKSPRNIGNLQQESPVYIVPGNAAKDRQAPPSYSSAPPTMNQLPTQMMIIPNPANAQSFPGLINPPAYSSEPAEEVKKS